MLQPATAGARFHGKEISDPAAAQPAPSAGSASAAATARTDTASAGNAAGEARRRRSEPFDRAEQSAWADSGAADRLISFAGVPS